MFSRTMTRSTPWNRDRDARQVPDRPQVRVQVERLAQPDVHAGEAAGRSASSPGPSSATLLRRIESSSSTGSACPVRSKASTPATCGSHSIETPRRVEDAQHRFGDFRSDAVAGNQRDGVCHSRTYQISRIKPRPRLTVMEKRRRVAAARRMRPRARSRASASQCRPARRTPSAEGQKLQHEQAGDDDRAAGVRQDRQPA